MRKLGSLSGVTWRRLSVFTTTPSEQEGFREVSRAVGPEGRCATLVPEKPVMDTTSSGNALASLVGRRVLLLGHNVILRLATNSEENKPVDKIEYIKGENRTSGAIG